MKFLIKQIVPVTLFLAVMHSAFQISFAADRHEMTHDKIQQKQSGDSDKRVSLNLPPMMKEHQLQNMRNHLQAVQEIVNYLSAGNFDAASRTAREKLGLTEDMKKMCNMFENEGFRKMGFAFHESGDRLGDVLKEKDLKKSLSSLSSMLQKCVACHATYKQ